MLQSKHPRYQIHLKSEQAAWTHTGESWLCPRYTPVEFAEDQDNFLAHRHLVGIRFLRCAHEHAVGSIGEGVDAKAFAKAVKADDVEVPIHLWNERI